MNEEEASLTNIAELVVRLMSDAEIDLSLRQASFPNSALCPVTVTGESESLTTASPRP